MNHYCNNKIPLEIRDNNITLIESRPVWNDESKWTEIKIAQIRFENESKTFTLYYADRNDKWHLYDFINPSQNLEKILTEIDNDPTGIFWG